MRAALLPACLAAICSVAMARASAEPVGAAVAVEREVTHSGTGETARLALGDTVIQDEFVTTRTASSAKLQFLDETQLFVGPASRVKLDRFVYNPDKTAATLTLNFMRGGFRFVTGKSPHQSYILTTPEAIIGLRGTTVGVFVSPGKTLVKLKQGGATVCMRKKGAPRCSEMEAVETTVEVTAKSISEAGLRRSRGPDFSIWCSARRASCGLPTSK